MSYLVTSMVKGHEYFRIMESYRENGKIKHRTLYNIGNKSKLCELLPSYVRNGSGEPDKIPPQAKPVVEVAPVRCRIHGTVDLLWSVADWIDIRSIMDEVFPPGTANGIPRSTSLLISAIHRACHPGSMSEVASWLASTSLPDYLYITPEVFTPQHLWEQMDDITMEQIKTFECKVFNKILEKCPEVKEKMSCLSSDFTNYYTYISNQKCRCTIAQLGHSKEGRTGQKIFCVAVILSPLLGIPIATMVYEGNHNDKTALKDFFEDIKERLSNIVDLNDITFVFDGGGTSEETLNNLPGNFITRGSIKSSPELYKIPLSDYEELHLDNDEYVKVYRTTAQQYGKKRTVLITLSDQLKAGQTAELDKQIGKYREEIDSLNNRLINPRAILDKRLDAITEKANGMMLQQFHMPEFISLKYDTVDAPDPVLIKQYNSLLAEKKREQKKAGIATKTGEIPTIEINGVSIRGIDDIPKVKIVQKVHVIVEEDKKQKMIETYYGKHLLVTSHDQWDSRQILTVYRDQECVERYFRDSKDTSHFSVRPSYHWTDQKIRVHVMLCYLGLSICRFATYLLGREQQYHVTATKLMERLERVQECIVFLTVNGEKASPQKVICELEGEFKEAWEMVKALKAFMKEHPGKAQ